MAGLSHQLGGALWGGGGAQVGLSLPIHQPPPYRSSIGVSTLEPAWGVGTSEDPCPSFCLPFPSGISPAPSSLGEPAWAEQAFLPVRHQSRPIFHLAFSAHHGLLHHLHSCTCHCSHSSGQGCLSTQGCSLLPGVAWSSFHKHTHTHWLTEPFSLGSLLLPNSMQHLHWPDFLTLEPGFRAFV